MKRYILFILAAALLTAAAFALPGDSCVVLGEELTLGETDSIFSALGVERGASMELTLSKEEAEPYFPDEPEAAASAGVYICIRSGGEGLSLSLTGIAGTDTAVAAALTAAGITDAEIRVAAPTETEAAAVLPAVFKAYETLTCVPIAPEVKAAAVAALTDTEAAADGVGIDTTQLEELLGDMDALFEGLSQLDDAQLCERVRQLAGERGLSLNESQTRQLAGLFRKIQNLRFRGLAEYVSELPGTVEKIRDTGESALSAAGTAWDSVSGFFRRVGEALSALFG